MLYTTKVGEPEIPATGFIFSMDYINFEYSELGEMLPLERERLHSWISKINPKNILEVGTGTGASTYYMAISLQEGSKIYSCDDGREPSKKLLKDFKNIEFFNIKSTALIQHIKKANIKIDYIFFDGPEEESVAMEDIAVLEDGVIQPGCYFSMHDWEVTPRKYDSGLSTKAAKIRPYIEKSNRWEKIEVLDGLNSDQTVGLCLYRYRE